MAPKAKAGAKPKKKAEESSISVTACCDVMKGVAPTPGAKVLSKGEACIGLWSRALEGETVREEIFKTGMAPFLLSFLEKASTEDKYAVMGGVQALARSEKHVAEIINNKVIVHAVNMLQGDHSRSKLPAAQLLSLLACRSEYSIKVADLALPSLLHVIMGEEDGWAQCRMTQHHVLLAIKSLIENTVGENPETKHLRRMALIELGIIPVLVGLVSYMPRMPPPAIVPAPPPVISKKSAKASKKSKTSSSGYPQGRKDAIATVAAACLRFLALCPEFVDGLLGSGSLQPFVSALHSSNAEQSAYICGILWEVCAEENVATAVEECGAVPALLHVASKYLLEAAVKKAGKKAKSDKKDDKKKKEISSNEPPPPPNYSEIAVCNATGALHHLSFLDQAKLKTFENATGSLWNVGLDSNNTWALREAGAPAESGRALDQDYDADPGATFLTQAPKSPAPSPLRKLF
eukprot:gene25468-11127_t